MRRQFYKAFEKGELDYLLAVIRGIRSSIGFGDAKIVPVAIISIDIIPYLFKVISDKNMAK